MGDKTSQLTLEYILLGLIRMEPLHGYALYQKLQDTSELSLIWHVKRSKLYYLLDKLEKEGLIIGKISQQEAYPDRKNYQLTDAGREVFSTWLLEPIHSGRHVRVAFLSKLYFALHQSSTLAERLIRNQQETCQEWITSLEDQLRDLQDPDFISRQVFQFRIGQVQAMLDWLEGCQNTLPQSEEVPDG